MNSIKLNNGEKVEFPGEARRGPTLLKILEEAEDRNGGPMTYEEAKKCPYMPERMYFYRNVFGSYGSAQEELAHIRRERKNWRPATEEEKEHLREITEEKRNRQGVAQVFRRPPYAAGKIGKASTEKELEKEVEEVSEQMNEQVTTEEKAKRNYRRKTENDLWDDLRRKYVELGGRCPTLEEIKADSEMCDSQTYSRRLGADWREKLEEWFKKNVEPRRCHPGEVLDWSEIQALLNGLSSGELEAPSMDELKPETACRLQDLPGPSRIDSERDDIGLETLPQVSGPLDINLKIPVPGLGEVILSIKTASR